MVQRKLFCYKRFSKNWIFENYGILVGLTHSNCCTMLTIIARPEVSSHKFLSFLRAIDWYVYCGGFVWNLKTRPPDHSLGASISNWVSLFFNFPGWFWCSFSRRITLWYPFTYTNNIFVQGKRFSANFGGIFTPYFDFGTTYSTQQVADPPKPIYQKMGNYMGYMILFKFFENFS